VVGDDSHRGVVVSLGAAVRLSGEVCSLLDERTKEVRVVVARLAFQDRRDALQSHAGIHRRLGQPIEYEPALLFPALELHEDEVPHLHPPAAIGGRLLAECRKIGVVAVEVVNLGARPARAGLAHLPEIVLHPEAQNSPVVEARDLFPEGARVFVRSQYRVAGIAAKDCHDETIFRHAETLRKKLPCEGDRVFLEIVAEAEIAEHLEERVVACRDAHVFEVVMLARNPDAFLARGRARERPLVLTGKDVLERDHAGVGEHQRRIVLGNERSAPLNVVSMLLEVVEERGANVSRREGHDPRTALYHLLYFVSLHEVVNGFTPQFCEVQSNSPFISSRSVRAYPSRMGSPRARQRASTSAGRQPKTISLLSRSAAE
jgi:hypothetical protein